MVLHPEIAEMYREHTVRRLYGLTHEEYLDEPADFVDHVMAFLAVENEVQQEAFDKPGG